jgi:hypothetical protein
MSTRYPLSLTVQVETEEKYTALLEFCRDNRIAMEGSNPYVPVFLDRTKKLPTSSFKHFCGSENLDKNGMLTEEDVYQVIMRYSKVFNLILPDGTIQLDKAMKSGFQTDMPRIRDYEILGLIVRAF